MTPQELAEIDRKVAEAIGLPVFEDKWWYGTERLLYDSANYPHITQYDDGSILLWSAPNTDGERWSPSTDWSDAMFAAEKVGLFKEYAMSQHTETGEWGIGWFPYGKFQPQATNESGPLAICHAILHLKGSK